MAAAQLLLSVGSGQGMVRATGIRSAVSEEGVGFSLSDTCNRDVALTVVKPKNPRILQPIQTVSRSAQSFLISTAQLLQIWRVED